MRVDDYLPDNEVEILADIKPDKTDVKRVFMEIFARHNGNLETIAHAGVWASQKLAIENEFLKLLLVRAYATARPASLKRGRKPAKPTGLGTGSTAKLKRPAQPVGAPPKHRLPSTTKALAIDAYDTLYEACGQNAKKAAQELLKKYDVDLSTEEGKLLVDNIRRKIGEVRADSGLPPRRRWGGRR